ncbi:efflux RND transporter periplasmic adaptor subunit [bacterium]|nr:efflux RND transporter periplasmic adaptor subunit [bacterium]
MDEMNRKFKILKMIWRRLPWIVVVSFIALAILLSGMVSKKSDEVEKQRKKSANIERPSINVVIQRLAPEKITDKINLPAIINAWEDLMITAEVEGLVVQMVAHEGDKVKAGDVICRIDEDDYKNNLNNISASYKLARLSNERLKKLREAKDITQAELDESDARLAEQEAGIADAKLKLERCKIKVPFAGVINNLPAKIGLLLKRGEPVAQIVDISKVKVDVGIPESDINSIQAVTECTLTIEALDNLSVKGKKIFLSVQPGSVARLYTLRLRIDNPDGSILPGMFCRVDVVKKVYENAIVAPLYSIISRDNNQIVFIEKDGKANIRKVELGVIEGWKVQVLSGLDPDDNLIIVGHRSLDDGQPVKILRTVKDPAEIYQ